ncbi:MAG: contractile injection system protein, VgrG/Pvc8 family [Pirellulales bacterium]
MAPPLPPTISLHVGGTPGTTGEPLSASWLRLLRSLEIESGVREQAIFRLKFALGMEASGDWLEGADRLFTPLKRVQIDVRLENRKQRLLNGYVTQFKLNLQADPCQSELEVVGLDALEKLKRTQTRGSYRGQPLRSVVGRLLAAQDISLAQRGVPDTGVPNPNREQTSQAQNDLEFLRGLADQHGCEVYVESAGDTDEGHFAPLSLASASRHDQPLVVQDSQGVHVRSASFYYDLSGPTVVEARAVDATGRELSPPVRVALRTLLGPDDQRLLGPPGFENVRQLQGHGGESRAELERRCRAELDKLSWLVIAKGEIETSDYRDVLVPRRRVEVRGAARAFSGPYLVWKVAHHFTRERHCQRFELRRQLGVH